METQEKPVSKGKKVKEVLKGKPSKTIRHRKVIRDSIQGITMPAIRRLSKRGGVKRNERAIYEEIRGVMKVYMENILSDSITLTEHARRKTVQKGDLAAALRMRGLYLGADASGTGKSGFIRCKTREKKTKEKKEGEEEKKPHRFKPGTVALREIRFQQKNSDSFAIPKSNFRRLTKEIGQDYHDELRYSVNFMDLFQLTVEEYLTDLFEAANRCAIHDKRQTISTKDVQLVRAIRREYL